MFHHGLEKRVWEPLIPVTPSVNTVPRPGLGESVRVANHLSVHSHLLLLTRSATPGTPNAMSESWGMDSQVSRPTPGKGNSE